MPPLGLSNTIKAFRTLSLKSLKFFGRTQKFGTGDLVCLESRICSASLRGTHKFEHRDAEFMRRSWCGQVYEVLANFIEMIIRHPQFRSTAVGCHRIIRVATKLGNDFAWQADDQAALEDSECSKSKASCNRHISGRWKGLVVPRVNQNCFERLATNIFTQNVRPHCSHPIFRS